MRSASVVRSLFFVIPPGPAGLPGRRRAVDVWVTVVDEKGNLVTDLTGTTSRCSRTARARRSSSSRPATASRGAADAPGLMLDASGSMERDIKLAQGAAIKFLNMLPTAEDITLVDFDTEVRITRYPQRDFARLVERIRQRKADGLTALYDALGTYLDGADPARGPQGAGDVHRRRRHPLGVVTSGNDGPAQGVARDGLRDWAGREHRVGASADADDTAATGGDRPAARRFFPRAMKEVESAYEKVLAEIKGQYHSATCRRIRAADGAWRKVEIKVKRPDLERSRTQGLLRPYKPPPNGPACWRT